MKRFATLACAGALLGLCAGSAALAGPHDGAWRSSTTGTFWSDGKLSKDFALTINLKFSGNRLDYESVNTTQPASPVTTTYVLTLDGKPTMLNGKDRFDQISVTKLSPDEFQILKTKNGDVIVGEFWTFRPDGKTFVRRGVGKSPQGVSKAYQETFVLKTR